MDVKNCLKLKQTICTLTPYALFSFKSNVPLPQYYHFELDHDWGKYIQNNTREGKSAHSLTHIQTF